MLTMLWLYLVTSGIIYLPAKMIVLTGRLTLLYIVMDLFLLEALCDSLSGKHK